MLKRLTLIISGLTVAIVLMGAVGPPVFRPAGSSGYVQYKSTSSASKFDAESAFQYDPSSNTLKLQQWNSIQDSDFATQYESIGYPAVIKRSQNTFNYPLLATNVNDSFSSLGYALWEFYQFGTFSGSIGWFTASPAGFVVKDSAGAIKHRLATDGSYSAGGIFANGSTLGVNGSIAIARTSVSANYTLASTNTVVFVDASGGARTMTLPDIGATGFGTSTYNLHVICKTDTSNNNVTFSAPGSGDSVGTLATLTGPDECVTLYADNTTPGTGNGSYRIMGRSAPTYLTPKTLAQLNAMTPVWTGLQYYCSDCVTDTVCVSTGTAVKSFARVSARTTPCQ